MREPFELAGIGTPPGRRKDILVRISESVTMAPVHLPVTVVHGGAPGPVVFATAAVHGDEVNGVEIVRRVRALVNPEAMGGTVVLVSIANPLGFARLERELPDGRDLNRSFPGSARGSMARQVAHAIFRKIVRRCDAGIDLHTAGRGRTNFPHVRAQMGNRRVAHLAAAFGAELVLDTPGEPGTLRRAAVDEGIPVIVYEAGEPLRFEEGHIRAGVRGVMNVLTDLGMVERSQREPPRMQVIARERAWMRAERGGVLVVGVHPGQLVERGQELAYHTKPNGARVSVVRAPFTGLVVGVATTPVAYPGTAVCHMVPLERRQARTWARVMERWENRGGE